MKDEMAMVIAVKNQRCQPEAPARKLNAAPVLCTSTRLKNGRTLRTSPYWNAELTHALVARSTTITAAETASQRDQRARALGMHALLARAFQVLGAAPAEGRVLRIGAHVLAPVPAALAFRVLARHHVHRRLRADAHGRSRG